LELLDFGIVYNLILFKISCYETKERNNNKGEKHT